MAPAWAGLAEAQLTLGINSEALPKEKLALAREAAEKALAIDDRLPDAHAWMAYIVWVKDWDWQGARREFQRAIELNPLSEDATTGYAQWLAYSGHPEAALEQIERLQASEPLSPRAASEQASILCLNRQYDRAVEVCQRFLASNPDAKTMYYWLGRAYAGKSMLPEAIAAMETPKAPFGPRGFGMLGNLYARAGRRNDALRLLDRALHSAEYVSPVSVANLYIGLGDRKEALKWLEKGYEDRTFSMTTLKVEPAFDTLHADAAFQALIARLRIP
jgi:tetratricopeptide (TPR) repeat protein